MQEHTVQICPAHVDATRQLSPCKQLLVSMVACALEDLSEANHLREALEWLTSRSERPYSYRWTCLQLDVDPDRLFRTYNDRSPP